MIDKKTFYTVNLPEHSANKDSSARFSRWRGPHSTPYISFCICTGHHSNLPAVDCRSENHMRNTWYPCWWSGHHNTADKSCCIPRSNNSNPGYTDCSLWIHIDAILQALHLAVLVQQVGTYNSRLVVLLWEEKNTAYHSGNIGRLKVHPWNYFCIFYLFELKFCMMVAFWKIAWGSFFNLRCS